MDKSEIINTFYYKLKPFIPREVQIWLRRKAILRKRPLYENVWPIDEKCNKPPTGWSGWPEGKRFALLLTHDVESAKGVERCVELAKLEERLGFRSSFNFVAEGYNIPREVFHYLKGKRFEIGVHGINHNGNPFRSKEVFQKQAVKINHYLKEWGSVGFRSPCMYHNLEWSGELNIDYDASTFDTDPFEPQPDGVGTIFPFWVAADGRATTASAISLTPGSVSPEVQPVTCNLQPTTVSQRGFVELPYTLPQDHTLFILMGEKDITIWKRKLDWIAERGGMALLIVHPDYMNFDGTDLTRIEYSKNLYIELLEYIKSNHNGFYWNTLPRELASYWKEKY